MVRVGTPLVLIRLERALVVIQVSLERTPISVGSPTRSRSMTWTTLSMRDTCSTLLVRSPSLRASPVNRTRPAYECTLARPGPSSSIFLASLLAFSWIDLSSTCSPVVRRSTATTAVVVAAPPIKTGAQAVKRPVIIKRQSKMATGLRKSWRLIIGVLRVIGYQYRHTWRGAGQYGPLGCAWCDDGAHRDGCLCWPGQRRFYRHHYRSGQLPPCRARGPPG